MTIQRQNELIIINKVLAALVVILALTAGYLTAQREEWLQHNESVTYSSIEDRK